MFTVQSTVSSQKFKEYVITCPSSGIEGQSCTFEDDKCGWTDASDDDFDWIRQQSNTGTPHTGPNGDHTIGANGWFVYIDNTLSGERGEKARFISPDVDFMADQPKCLIFWYHMHGAHIERLNVYLGVTNDLGEVLWTRRGTQGNEWKKAQITLSVSVNATVNVIFEAIHGIVQGDISLDDVTLEDGECLQGIEGQSCTFEDDKCGWTDASDDDFDWIRQQSNTGTPHTGPNGDHTIGANGWFVYIDNTLSGERGEKARFISPDVDFMADQPKCLIFWYHMHGAHIERLNVYLGVTNDLGEVLWTRRGTQGTYLYFDASNIEQGTSAAFYSEPFQMKQTESMCINFWYHMYGASVGELILQQILSNGDVIDLWTMSGDQGNRWLPGRVEYSQTQDYYLNFNASRSFGPWGDICIDDIVLTTGTCLRIIESCTFESDICGWVNANNDDFDWIRQQSDTQTPHTGPTGDHTIGGELPGSCDFEHGICSWQNVYTDDIDWVENKGGTSTGGTGPTGDHTIGTSEANGWFVYIDNTLAGERGDLARFISPDVDFDANQPKCLTFCGTYNVIFEGVHGIIQGDIALDDVTLEDGKCLQDYCDFEDGTDMCGGTQDQSDTLDFTLAGGTIGSVPDHTLGTPSGHFLIVSATEQNKYKKARFITPTFYAPTTKCLQFHHMKNGDQNLGVLNVYAKIGSTLGTALWTKSVELEYGWYEEQVSIVATEDFKIVFEVVRSSGNEGFIGIDDFFIFDGSCVSVGGIGTLTVQQLLSNGDVIDLWTMSGNQGNQWMPGRVGFYQTQDYYLIFNATRGNGPSGDICIDDITMTRGYCSPSHSPFDCNFEGDLCGWNQTADDELDWIRNQGDTGSSHTGPSWDHTRGVTGWYIYLDNNADQFFGDAARLESPAVDFVANQPKCFTFWYHIYGAHIGSLSVYLQAGQRLNPIWAKRTTLGDQWNQARVNLLLTSDETHNVVLEVTQGYRVHGDVAVDDISLEDGYCVQDYFGCDFEANTLCGGEFDQTADLNWTLTSADDRNGPIQDNTYGTIAGHYLLVSASSTNTGRVARYFTAITSTTTTDVCSSTILEAAMTLVFSVFTL
uniref:Apical endosomal glycoprotein-like n=1 Tax=Saccoglossus kowalevskii TaxID=10224 RepID=A0ABM0MM40_SACKO|nr:PREDICTED: apical endosomal glycoprotein-like [Saccoglossus kowalevskii]